MTKTIRISRALIGIALLTSCRNYEPKPLALDASERAFLVRTIDAPTLAQYSAQLGARASAANAFNAADGLSLDEAELIALVFNRQLRLARLEAGVTAATAENAGLWRDPRLGVDLSQIVDGVTGGVEAMVSLGLTLPLSGRLELEKQQAQAQHRAELVRVAQQEWTVVADLRRAWVRHASLAAELQAAGDFLVRVAQVTAIVDRMESAGEIARIEARLFRIEDAKLRGQLQAIESDLTRTMHEIESLMGMPPRSDRNFDADFAFADALGRGHHDARAQAHRRRVPRSPSHGLSINRRSFVLPARCARSGLTSKLRRASASRTARGRARLASESRFRSLTEIGAPSPKLRRRAKFRADARKWNLSG